MLTCLCTIIFKGVTAPNLYLEDTFLNVLGFGHIFNMTPTQRTKYKERMTESQIHEMVCMISLLQVFRPTGFHPATSPLS